MFARMSRRGGLMAAGILSALAGLAAGLGLVLWSSSDAGRDAPDIASMDEISAPDMTSADDPTDGGTTPPVASEAPTTEAPATDAPATDDVAGIAACARAAVRADAAVDAARTSLGNWKTHYGAQIAFDRGEIDGAEAKRRWTVSKEPAQRNIDAFVAADAAVSDDDPCGALQVDEIADRERRRVRRCATRTAAASDVVAATGPALKDWRTHLRMMATKDEYTIDEYLRIWRRAVADAPGAMDDFDAAVAAYEDTADCPIDADVALRTGTVPARPALAFATDHSPGPVICVLADDPRRRTPVPV